MNIKSFLFIAGTLLLFLASCRHEPLGIEAQPAVCFATDVLPVIQSSCGRSGCHDGSGESRMNLRTAAGIRRNVTPNKPFESSIYTAMTTTWGEIMPPAPNPPLSKENRSKIFVWILQGADTTCTTIYRRTYQSDHE